VADLLNVKVAATGMHPFVGLLWWEFADNRREKTNWGRVTLSDNAYDGREAVQAIGKDPWGFPTGGEERDYGGPAVQLRHPRVLEPRAGQAVNLAVFSEALPYLPCREGFRIYAAISCGPCRHVTRSIFCPSSLLRTHLISTGRGTTVARYRR
jgi:hypothetical protein